MRARIVVLACVAAVTFSASAGAEVVGVRSADFYRLVPCPKLSAPVTVDGRLDEWDLSAAQIVLTEKSLKRWGGYEPPVKGDADASGRASIGWDAKGLYFAAEVTDDTIAGLPADPKAKVKAMWNYDGFMLMFFPTPALVADTSRHLDRPEDIDRMRQWGLNYYEPGAKGRQHREQVHYVTRKTASGYTLEARLPWKALGFSPRVGDRYRLNIIMPDSDDALGAGSTNWGQLIWAGSSATAHYPQRYAADVRLMDSRRVGAEIVPATTDISPGRPTEFQVIVDALAAGGRFREAFARDAEGKSVWSEGLAQALPANKRTTLSMRIPAGTLKPETALVLGATIATSGGKEVTVSVPISVGSAEVVRSGPPSPRDRATISATADPSRYALPSSRRVYSRKQWKPVTREDYYKLACELSNEPYRVPTDPPEQVAAKPHCWAWFNAIYSLARYVHDKDPRMLAMTKAMMRATYEFEKQVAGKREGGGVLSYADVWRWWFYMKDHKLLDTGDEAWLRELVLLNARRFVRIHSGFERRERGAQNRSFAWATALRGAAYANPDIPEAARWKAYAQEVWDEWWPYRDTDENTDGYSAGCIAYVLPTWGRLMGVDVWKDKGYLELAGRWLHEIAPCGARPSYGDGTTFNGTAMANLAMFEQLATITKDGRYKWAAHRLFEYATQNTRDWKTWHLVQDGAATSLFWAYLLADDSVAERVPSSECTITTRKYAEPVPVAIRDKELRWFRMTQKTIPNKLILRSGMGRLSMWAMVQLCPSLGHSAGVAPNITCLMKDYSALLTDQSYMDRAPAYHNVVTVEDLEGLAATGAEERITVPDLGETGMAAYACVDIDLYRGWPVRHRRQIVFLKNHLIWVKDDVLFHDGFLCKVGPRWQTRQVFPAVGRNWANTFIDFHLSTGLGMGSGLHRTENPATDLLVWFLPQKDCRVTYKDRSKTNIWQTLPQQVQYVWEGLSRAGQKQSFGTVLWPHEPDRDPSKWAKRLEAVAATTDVSAVRARINKNEAFLMVINDTGKPQTAGPVTTDARLCIVQESGGKPVQVMVYNGRTVTYGDREILKLDKPQTVQKAVK